jgi:hypothetical protein
MVTSSCGIGHALLWLNTATSALFPGPPNEQQRLPRPDRGPLVVDGVAVEDRGGPGIDVEPIRKALPNGLHRHAGDRKTLGVEPGPHDGETDGLIRTPDVRAAGREQGRRLL